MTKKVVADTASGGVWVNRTPQKVIRTGVDRSTPGNIRNAVRVKHAPSLVMIGIVGTSLTCGITGILQVVNERHCSLPGLVGQTQKLVTAFYGKLPDDLDYAYIFSKLIGHKIYIGSSGGIYLRCRMNFVNDPAQTQAPRFMNLGFSDINELDEICFLSTPATRI